MDENVLQMIGQYGFPIVMCLLFWYDKQKSNKELTQAVTNNTIVVEKLLTKLESHSDLK